MDEGYERYVEPYNYEVRDRRVRIARGLQVVDGLTTGPAFDEPAQRYVQGEIDAAQLRELVDAYYNQKVSRALDRYHEEADLVSARICALLESNGFFFAPVALQNIHERLFHGLMEEPYYERNYRDYNVTKKEFVLARESVEYGDCATLPNDLDSVFESYLPAPFNAEDVQPYASSLAAFITRIWQLHPFAEGNTRTVAVFLQKLLRAQGFTGITNEIFEENSLRFRNALVRASYSNEARGVSADATYINCFMECLLTNTDFPYRNRDMASAKLYAAKGMLPPAEESSRIG